MEDDEFEAIMAQARAEDKQRAHGKKRAAAQQQPAVEAKTEEGQREKALKKDIAPSNVGCWSCCLCEPPDMRAAADWVPVAEEDGL
jgi:hypothetical protein